MTYFISANYFLMLSSIYHLLVVA